MINTERWSIDFSFFSEEKRTMIVEFQNLHCQFMRSILKIILINPVIILFHRFWFAYFLNMSRYLCFHGMTARVDKIRWRLRSISQSSLFLKIKLILFFLNTRLNSWMFSAINNNSWVSLTNDDNGINVQRYLFWGNWVTNGSNNFDYFPSKFNYVHPIYGNIPLSFFRIIETVK